MAFKIGWNDGHTLSGPGTGASNIIKETDRNRAIGKLARKYLLEYEDVVIINCTIDASANDMAEAVGIANRNNCDLFVSNHVNAGGGKGFETFYNRKASSSNIEKAKIIHKHLVATKSCLLDRRCCDDYSYKGFDLYVLRNTKMDAILCEIGFVDNRECINAVNNDEVARAYAEGIAAAYGLKKKVIIEEGVNRSMYIFSKNWYLKRYSDISKNEKYKADPYQHYLDYGKKEGRQPLPAIPQEYCEGDYLELNPDVAAAVKKGSYTSGLEHYLMYGFCEGRKVSKGDTDEAIKKRLEELEVKLQKIRKIAE